MKTHICKVCYKEFYPYHFANYICSDECRRIAHTRKTSRYYYKNVRERKMKPCPICGKPNLETQNLRHEQCVINECIRIIKTEKPPYKKRFKIFDVAYGLGYTIKDLKRLAKND